MANEITIFIQKNQKTIGIIALILFALAVFTKNQGIEIPLFSGSILGGFQGLGISIGIIMVIGGILLSAFGVPIAGLTFIIAGALMAGGNFLIAVTSFLNALSKPMVAVILGVILAFLIFRKKK